MSCLLGCFLFAMPQVINVFRGPEIAKCIYRELQVIRDTSITKKSKYIVQSFDAFFIEDELHIIMEFMDLGSLKGMPIQLIILEKSLP